MGRYYQFMSNITEEESMKILNEMEHVDKVQHVELSKDHHYLEVETNEMDYPEVMTKAVNIVRKYGHGCEICFSRFAYDLQAI